MDDYTQPESDIVVIRGRGVDYSPNLPNSNAVLLLAEVADSSLEFDRGKKLEQYARAGISTYWIVNLRDNQVEVYTRPNRESAGYSQCQILKRDETVEISIDGRVLETVSVQSILDGTI
ncbi:MAG TPA: Uma2 family endonuclease [Schlesneria sp.]